MSSPQAKPENMLLNLVCNIVVPTVVLTNLSAEKRLGPLWALIVAIAFPVAYGVYDLATRKKTNVLSCWSPGASPSARSAAWASR
jgi:hypothetical protein